MRIPRASPEVSETVRRIILREVSQWRSSIRYLQHAAQSGTLLTRAWITFACIELLLLLTFITSNSFSSSSTSHKPDIAQPWNTTAVLDHKKLALLLETRPIGILIPLLVHFIGVVPPDWVFRFMGSEGSVAFVRSVPVLKRWIDSGKLETTYLPLNVTTNSQESLSVFLTDPWTYNVLFQPAETLLIFQTDSILCANSERSINEWTKWSWVGAPWGFLEYGGNGGLSVRNMSAIQEVLSLESRPPRDKYEDQWLVDMFLKHKIPKMAHRNTARQFSAETLYSYHPMGYHTGHSGTYLGSPIWGNPSLRNEMYEWCPEVKMGVDMDVLEFLPGNCSGTW